MSAAGRPWWTAPLRRAGRHRLACFLLLALVGISARRAVPGLLGLEPAAHCCETMNISTALAGGRGFADAYGPGTGPTAHTTPVYPALLAGLRLLFGKSLDSALTWLTIALAAAAFALMAVSGRKLGFGAAAALAAGAVGAIVAVNPVAETDGSFENFLAGPVFVGYVMAASPAARGAGMSMSKWAWLGAFGGAAMLVSGVLAAPVAFSWAWIAWARRRDGGLWRLPALPAAALLVLSPWAVRNWIVLGEPFLLRSNFGLELAVSNNDAAGPVEVDQKRNKTYLQMHPFLNAGERARYVALGEARYMKLRLREALAWIRRNPARFARLTAERAGRFWFRTNDRIAPSILTSLMTVLGLAGIAWDWRRNPGRAGLYLGLLLTYSAVYAVVQVMPRYRAPVNWILLLYSAWLVRGLARRLGWLKARRAGAVAAAGR